MRDRTPPPRPEPSAGPSRPPRAATPTILLIEDNPEDQAWAAGILRNAGYAVETAATGAEALARCGERRFDGITLDLLLPDMTGWDVLRRLRESGLHRNVPMIVLSVAPTKVAAAGFVVRETVAKPARAEELLAALTRAGVPPSEAKPILIVDDDPNTLKLAAAALGGLGYRTIVAADGESALRAADDNPPAAVILDLLMPGMDGFEFLDRFQRGAHRDTSVIVWTVKELTPDDRERLEAYAQAVVLKHFGGVERLLETLRAHIPGSPRAGSSLRQGAEP